MLLPLTDGLVISNRADYESAIVADRHYSRQTIGSRQFTGPGRSLVLRNTTGSVVFVWMWHHDHGLQLQRWDQQTGFCCSLFRNESARQSSEIIFEAEDIVRDQWGANHMYTYIDPRKVHSPNPGYCFKVAGWTFVRRTPTGKHLLVKESA
jgi:hypothetical protein